MENSKKTRINFIFLMLRIIGILLIVAGIIFFSVEFNNDFNHDLEIEVGIGSPTDEFYTIEIEGELDNHSKEIVSGTLNVKLQDSKGRITTATFNNVTILGKSEYEIDTLNNSVTTYLFDSENGLDYDMEIVEVTVGSVEFLEYTSRPVVAIPLLICGVGLLLVVQLILYRSNIKNSVTEDEKNT